ncbi:hypothetical protein D3C75_1368290 [compost metagenome]
MLDETGYRLMTFTRMPTRALPRTFAGIGFSATLGVVAGFGRLGGGLFGFFT